MKPTKAGTVTWRRSDAGVVQILLITSRLGDRWILPMGTIEAGEKPAAAAVRETAEEAGVVVNITEKLGRFGYRDLKAREQICSIFLARFKHEINWQESAQRKRVWRPVDEALSLAADDFRPFIAQVRDRIDSQLL